MLLESESHFSVVGEAADGEELLILLEKTAVDVVVVDLSMPKMGGLECIKEIRSRRHGCKNTGLTMFGDETYIREVMQAGQRLCGKTGGGCGTVCGAKSGSGRPVLFEF